MGHLRITTLCALAAAALLFLTLVPTPGAGQQASLVAIVHPSNRASSVSADQIKNIYLGRVTFWPGQVPVRAYSRPPESPAGRAFLRSVLGMTPTRFRRHWQSRQLSGQGVAPPVVGSIASLIERVSQDRGGIGYALSSEATTPGSGVRVVPVR